jgi:ADP-ribosylglycohydrolase
MKAKTSDTDPLQIQSVDVLGTGGVIGMTLCPGRKGSSLAGGSWDRDLSSDLEVVRTWNPDIVIALLEDFEFAKLGIPNFKRDVKRAGLPWVFLPIVDGGIPGVEFAERWEKLGTRTRNILRRGGRVLIHCRAGLGRTGLLAALLLVELGEDNEVAIQRVRAARPKTIETKRQEEFVRGFGNLISLEPSRDSRIEGCILGAAIGDALGSAFEFLSPKQIHDELGSTIVTEFHPAVRGSLLYPRASGQPTDDTAMALSVADVVAETRDLSARRFADAFLKDLDQNSGRFGDMFWKGGPGGATTRALWRLERGAEADTCGALEDGGNGAAMRSHPIGVLHDRAEVLRVAALQAKITHGHPAAVAASQAVAVLVWDAFHGLEPEIEPPFGVDEPLFLEAWLKAHKGLRIGSKRLPDHLLSVEMSGWHTVAAAHAISYIYQNDPFKAIGTAAASGGDTDTVASIVGAIVGARNGRRFLPDELVEEIGSKWQLDDAIANLKFVLKTRFDGPLRDDHVSSSELRARDIPAAGKDWNENGLHTFGLSFNAYEFI